MKPQAHWNNIYQTKNPAEVSWYQPHATLSMQLIQHTGVGFDEAIIDVGAGASTLVDNLLDNSFSDLTVLDISESALQEAQHRLGSRAAQVKWIEADITRTDLSHHAYSVWHDRATFHFLTDPADRQRYVEIVQHAVKPGGHVIVATFATDGPTQCSGLEVMQYDAEHLHGEFGADFDLIESLREAHQTPFGTEQKFIYCYCRKS